eukprot:CAMPEP_0197309696 /NCGR_PEP_ID=MMETSP0891-20130614/8307_1 /TAXON_ID=44058 ORGANISM="Aureoumbra lagunensis, Strain CCMP1510" /NCGR_SAMPLE_ID=MMETSP0891 /ASSEMBLY_ACC=CAM_ASM_000534 /LENGTH=669 /DNA_ID=CAMNT_0042794943 /DNA_START=582 /DNA_END=2594 /DNA_ORIENTATION=-
MKNGEKMIEDEIKRNDKNLDEDADEDHRPYVEIKRVKFGNSHAHKITLDDMPDLTIENDGFESYDTKYIQKTVAVAEFINTGLLAGKNIHQIQKLEFGNVAKLRTHPVILNTNNYCTFQLSEISKDYIAEALAAFFVTTQLRPCGISITAQQPRTKFHRGGRNGSASKITLELFNVLVVFYRKDAELAAILNDEVISRGYFYYGVNTTNETRFEVIFDPSQLGTSSSGASAGFIGHLPSTTQRQDLNDTIQRTIAAALPRNQKYASTAIVRRITDTTYSGKKVSLYRVVLVGNPKYFDCIRSMLEKIRYEGAPLRLYPNKLKARRIASSLESHHKQANVERRASQIFIIAGTETGVDAEKSLLLPGTLSTHRMNQEIKKYPNLDKYEVYNVQALRNQVNGGIAAYVQFQNPQARDAILNDCKNLTILFGAANTITWPQGAFTCVKANMKGNPYNDAMSDGTRASTTVADDFTQEQLCKELDLLGFGNIAIEAEEEVITPTQESIPMAVDLPHAATNTIPSTESNVSPTPTQQKAPPKARPKRVRQPSTKNKKVESKSQAEILQNTHQVNHQPLSAPQPTPDTNIPPTPSDVSALQEEIQNLRTLLHNVINLLPPDKKNEVQSFINPTQPQSRVGPTHQLSGAVTGIASAAESGAGSTAMEIQKISNDYG